MNKTLLKVEKKLNVTECRSPTLLIIYVERQWAHHFKVYACAKVHC